MMLHAQIATGTWLWSNPPPPARHPIIALLSEKRVIDKQQCDPSDDPLFQFFYGTGKRG